MADTGSVSVLDIYDSELEKILAVTALLRERGATKQHNYEAFQREIEGRFADIGFRVEVNWYTFGYEGTPGEVDGSAMPEITITGRILPEAFDRDRQVHEVTRNVLGIPGQEGVIKTDPETLKRFLGEQGAGHGHAH